MLKKLKELKERKKEPIIPKQPSIKRCMEYCSNWDDDERDEEDEEAALIPLMIEYLL